MASENNNQGGINFLGLLGLLFIGLKLGCVIHWSWWLVLLPIYGPFVIFIVLIGFFGLVYAVAYAVEGKR